MERVTQAWRHLGDLPGYNGAVLIATLLIGIVLLWAAAGATLTSWIRYRPQNPLRSVRSGAELIQGRRAWAIVIVLVGMVIWSAYRVYALWALETPVNDLAVLVEIPRAIGAIWVSWAWWPGVEAE